MLKRYFLVRLRSPQVFLLVGLMFSAYGPVAKDAGSGKCSLLVAVNDQQAAKTKLQHLMAYHFGDGNFTGGEKIVSVKTLKDDGKNTSYIRFDLGYNYVYRNQYVIT